jgi:PH (Pleckstrin Homology) domain-containing protein
MAFMVSPFHAPPCHAGGVSAQVVKRWRVRPVQVVLETGGAVIFTILAASAGDRPMLLLSGIAAVALVVLALRDIVVPVRLTADREGVTVVRGFGRRRIAWSEIERVGLYESERFGLTTRKLEIDTGETLYLLTAGDLGAPADEVERDLQAIRSGTGMV